jgi:hypothetical protein
MPQNSSKEMPETYTENQRPPCPFYGFDGRYVSRGFGFMDVKVNCCALITNSFSPCQMESRQHKEPNWDQCPFYNSEDWEDFKKRVADVRIYPQEFWPVDTEEWEGIRFNKWLEFLNEVHGKSF